MSLTAKARERQDYVRRSLLAQIDVLPVAATLSVSGMGRYCINRWYRFAQLAMVRNGALLAPDTQWETVRAELDDWPILLWMSLLEDSEFAHAARTVYGSFAMSRFAVTQRDADTGDWQNVTLGWRMSPMANVTQLAVWQWLGPVGGEQPAV